MHSKNRLEITFAIQNTKRRPLLLHCAMILTWQEKIQLYNQCSHLNINYNLPLIKCEILMVQRNKLRPASSHSACISVQFSTMHACTLEDSTIAGRYHVYYNARKLRSGVSFHSCHNYERHRWLIQSCSLSSKYSSSSCRCSVSLTNRKGTDSIRPQE